MTPDELKMPVVKRIVGDLQLELKYYQCSRLQNCSEIVADIVTRLLFIVKTDPKGSPYNGSSMHLTELAMEVVRAVLKKLSSVSPSMNAHYSRPAAARMAYSIHQKLVKSLYTPDDMKDFLSTRNGTLMTAIAEHVSKKISKLFQHPFQHLKPPSVVRLFMTASNYRSSLRTGERLVVDIEAVTSVVTLVLQQLHCERDTEFVFQPRSWPLVDHVVNRLTLSGMQVTKKKSKVTCYFTINDMFSMVNAICQRLLAMYDTMESLMEALSYKNRMVSRDISHLVSEQIKMVCQRKKMDLQPTKMPHTFNMENVICSVVARFVHILVPVTMADKEDLIMCLLLADQIRYLTEVIVYQSQESRYLSLHLKELSPNMIDELGDIAFNHYIETFPLYNVQEQLHMLVMDKIQSYMISNMIASTLLDHVKLLSHEELKELPTSGALQSPAELTVANDSHAVKPPPGFVLPNTSAAVKPPPGFVVPGLKPPPGFAVPDASPAVNPRPGFAVPGLKPQPGFAVPCESAAITLPPGFALPNASPAVKPPPGFSVPATLSAVKPPPGFALPDGSSTVRPSPGFVRPDASLAVMEPPGFALPSKSSSDTSPSGLPSFAVKPPPGFALPNISPAVKPHPGFALPDAPPAVKPPPGFAVPAVKLPPGIALPDLPDAPSAVKPPPGFAVPAVKLPGFALPCDSTAVTLPPGFALPNAVPAVKPPPGFSVPDTSSAVKPPPGFPLPHRSSTVKPPPGFALPNTLTAVKPPPGFSVPAASPAVKPPPGFAVPVVKPPSRVALPDASPALKPVNLSPPGFSLPEVPSPIKPPPGFCLPAVLPPPGFALPDASSAVKAPPGFALCYESTAITLSPGFVLCDALPAVMPPPEFSLPHASCPVKLPPGFCVPTVKSPPDFAVPDISPAVKLPPGLALPDASPPLRQTSRFPVPAVKPPPGFAPLKASPALRPPPGFAPLKASPAVKPPPGFAPLKASPALRPPPGFDLPNASSPVKPPPGFCLPAVMHALPDVPAVVEPPLECDVGVSSSSVKSLPRLALTKYSRDQLRRSEEETQDKDRLNHSCVQDKTIMAASNSSEDDQNQAQLAPEQVKSTKKRGLKGFLQKVRKALRCWPASRETEAQGTELSRNH
ncbi:hypothetical protein ACEWY4_020027 [Coilia grayii]|uniref:Uncharacterized protein n=1 Tax=Coilia grayii TaxID=363190 RepID=A0ABD1JBR0_9TELE